VNYTRIAAAALIAWLVSIPLGAFIHHGILGSLYSANAAAFRPDPEVVRRLPIGYAVQLVGFFIASTMYAQKFAAEGGIIEGLRFGLLISTVLVTFAVILNYVTQPISLFAGRCRDLRIHGRGDHLWRRHRPHVSSGWQRRRS